MVGKPGSRFAPPVPGEMDQRIARRYAKFIRVYRPHWDVRVVNIAQGLNHIHIDRPADGITECLILRRVEEAQKLVRDLEAE